VYVLLRRETSRMIDVEWMVVNRDYVLEVIRLVRATNNAELIELTERIEATHPLLVSKRQSVRLAPEIHAPAPQARYVNTLR